MNYVESQGKKSGSKIFISDDYQYIKNRTRGEKFYLTCQLRTCHGTGCINLLTQVLKHLKPHNHPIEEYGKVKHDLRSELLNAAQAQSRLTTREIFNDVTRNHPGGHLLTYRQMSSGMNARRRVAIPKRPQTAAEFVERIHHTERLQQYFVREVKNDDGEVIAAIFGHQDLIQAFSNADLVLFDGTFFTVPSPFYQLFNLMFEAGGSFFPAFNILMVGKSFDEYLCVFQAIREIVPNFSPTKCMADFERASRNAMKAVFPGVRVSGCLFHFSRNVFKHVQKLKLCKQFTKNSFFRKWVKMLMSLAMLPANAIHESHDQLLVMKAQIIDFSPEDLVNLNRFCTYFERTWISGISPEDLSVFGLEHATNNGCESYHSWLKQTIKTHRPNAFNFTLTLNLIFEDKALDFHRYILSNGNPINRERRRAVTENLDRRRAAEAILEVNAITNLEFLKTVSHTLDGQVRELQLRLRRNPLILQDDPEVVDINNISEEDEIPDNPDENANEEPDDIQSDNSCLICTGPRDGHHAFVPCGHAIACQNCCNRIMLDDEPRCPYCRTSATNVIRVRIQTL